MFLDDINSSWTYDVAEVDDALRRRVRINLLTAPSRFPASSTGCINDQAIAAAIASASTGMIHTAGLMPTLAAATTGVAAAPV